MRVLIICAGNATRWGDYQGVPKHLVKLMGEPILHRSVRLINELTPDTDVRIIAKDHRDPLYRVPGARTYKARLTPENRGADKFLSSRHLWADDDRTVILYGDLFVTRDAMRRMLSTDAYEGGWRIYARFDGSQITGCRGGENFAHVIDPEAHTAYEAALHRIVALQQAGVIQRAGGWEQYRAMHDLPDGQILELFDDGSPKNPRLNHYVEIDDATEDMDHPDDWRQWCWHYSQYSPELRTQYGMTR